MPWCRDAVICWIERDWRECVGGTLRRLGDVVIAIYYYLYGRNIHASVIPDITNMAVESVVSVANVAKNPTFPKPIKVIIIW
jgi:hypothetical protein